LTGIPIDTITITVLCPHCDQNTLKLLHQLISSNTVFCNWCNKPIGLSTKDWRETIRKAVEAAATGHGREHLKRKAPPAFAGLQPVAERA
jgi:hypothetical protein